MDIDPDIDMAVRYIGVIECLSEDPFSENCRLSHANLLWMCLKIISENDGWPKDKLGRWLGFIQGVLAAQRAICVDSERDYSRPLYHKRYSDVGIDPPETSSNN